MGIIMQKNNEISPASNSPVEFNNMREQQSWGNESDSIIEGDIIRGTRKMNINSNNMNLTLSDLSEENEGLVDYNRNSWGLTSYKNSEGGASSEEKKETETPKSDSPKDDDKEKTDESPKENSYFSEGGNQEENDLLNLKNLDTVRETSISEQYTESNVQNHERFLKLLDNVEENELNSEHYMDGGAKKNRKKSKRR